MKKKSSTFKVCKHEGCFKQAAPERNECYKCRSLGIRIRKPIDVCFYWIKKSAKKRHIEFTITLPWFREWVVGTGYMEGKGRLTESLTIDRKDNLKGYTPDNMQVMTKHDNCCKYHSEDEKRETLVNEFEGDMPF